jgi:glutamine transport system permease protein
MWLDMLGLDTALMYRNITYLLGGAVTTLVLTAAAVGLGLLGGTFLGMARLSQNRVINGLASAYVTFFRGTPLLVQIFITFYGFPGTTRWSAAIIALSMNSSAYIAEIVRAGIQSIDIGQTEAAIAGGLSPSQRLRYIILPQAFRRIIPPLGNEFIAMLKDSSLVSVIALEDLLRRAQLVVTSTYKPFEMFIMAAVMYLIMTSVISWFVTLTEKHLQTNSPARLKNASVKKSMVA